MGSKDQLKLFAQHARQLHMPLAMRHALLLGADAMQLLLVELKALQLSLHSQGLAI